MSMVLYFEISFRQVPHTQNGEPGWLAGEIRGHTGWFPESYVEPLDAPAESAEAIDAAATTARLEYVLKCSRLINFISSFQVSNFFISFFLIRGIAEVPENVSDAGSAADPALAAAQAPPAADGEGKSLISFGIYLCNLVPAIF